MPAEDPKKTGLESFFLLATIVLLGVVFILVAHLIDGAHRAFKPSAPGAPMMSVIDWLFYEAGHLVVLEIGIGLIAGCVIALFVDRYMREKEHKELREREERIQRNVFEELFKTAIPGEVVAEMYKSIFQRRFIRKDLRMELTFRPHGAASVTPLADNDFIVVERKLTFNAFNMFDQAAPYVFDPEERVLLRAGGQQRYPFKELRMRVTGGQERHISAEQFEKGQAQRVDNAKRGELFKFTEPQEVMVPSHRHAEVCYVIENICRATDTETFVSMHAAENLRVTIHLEDRRCEGLDFWVDSTHREDPEVDAGSGMGDPRRYEWVLSRPILPYHGVMIRWRPKRAVTGGSP